MRTNEVQYGQSYQIHNQKEKEEEKSTKKKNKSTIYGESIINMGSIFMSALASALIAHCLLTVVSCMSSIYFIQIK